MHPLFDSANEDMWQCNQNAGYNSAIMGLVCTGIVGMYELPLFPLNSVLFPGMPIELHIFEERYKQMIELCMEKRQPFGVVLIRRGRAEGGPLAEPHLVGCTAHITQSQPLAQGRMNIVAVGHERFEIVSLSHDRPYLVGMVKPYPIDNTNPKQLLETAQLLRYLVERFLKIMNESGQIRFKTQQPLPRDPVALAYLASVLLQIPPVQQRALLTSVIASEAGEADSTQFSQTFIAQQQILLETEQASNLLFDLCKIYRREVALLDRFLNSPYQEEKISPFSNN